MLAHAFLAVATAAERDTRPAPTGLITLTVNEFRRLFDALLLATQPHRRHPAGLVTLAPKTPTPSPPMPLPTTPTPMITIYGCSTDMGGILSRGRVKRRPEPSSRPPLRLAR